METGENVRIIQKNIREAAGCKIIYSLLQNRRQFDLEVISENNGEHIYIQDFTRSRSYGLKLLSLLSEELVYPCHLPEILDDLLGQTAQI